MLSCRERNITKKPCSNQLRIYISINRKVADNLSDLFADNSYWNANFYAVLQTRK